VLIVKRKNNEFSIDKINAKFDYNE